MQIDFWGANCLRLKTNGVSLVFDDNLKALGGQSVTSKDSVVCLTNSQLIPVAEIGAAKIIFDTPGSYEVGDVLIEGVWSSSFMPDLDPPHATIFKITSENMNLVIAGHIRPELNDEQLEALGLVDVLFVPVGGNGYTLDAEAARQVVKSIDPKLVIPTHFHQPNLKYPVPQAEVEEFAKLIAGEAEDIIGALRLKRSDLGEQLTLKIIRPA